MTRMPPVNPPSAVKLYHALRLAIDAAEELALDLRAHDCGDYRFGGIDHCDACHSQHLADGMPFTLHLLLSTFEGGLTGRAEAEAVHRQAAAYLDALLRQPAPDAVTVGRGRGCHRGL